MGETIEQSAGQPFGAEDLGPFLEGQVRGDQGRATLIALAEHLEEQFGAGFGLRNPLTVIDVGLVSRNRFNMLRVR